MCPHCSQHIEAPEDLLGTVVDCPACNKRFQLPKASNKKEYKTNLKCRLGVHSWKGCICSDCGKIRDEKHDWSRSGQGCKCLKCGIIRNEGHDWSKDCEKCASCGMMRAEAHDWRWNCEKCATCGKMRAKAHDWSRDCENCGKCGRPRSGAHDWSKDCDTCAICGSKREHTMHDWSKDCETCSICGVKREQEHDWTRNCELCAKCGLPRPGAHSWNGCRCLRCGVVQHDWSKDCEICGKCGESMKPQGHLLAIGMSEPELERQIGKPSSRGRPEGATGPEGDSMDYSHLGIKVRLDRAV